MCQALSYWGLLQYLCYNNNLKKRSRIQAKILQVLFLGWLYIAENIKQITDAHSSVVGAWKAVQMDAGSNLYRILLFLLYSKSEGCWFESRHSKAIKFCLHKYEIFPPLFSSKGLRTCPTTVKVTKKYSTQKRRLGFAALYIVTLCIYSNPGRANGFFTSSKLLPNFQLHCTV